MPVVLAHSVDGDGRGSLALCCQDTSPPRWSPAVHAGPLQIGPSLPHLTLPWQTYPWAVNGWPLMHLNLSPL